ncbi:VOC family protein [Asanoa iriomotensis]|uniref:Glyoxalase n=1 Tax=Asanoa iriomotensis TaxID=234613 RepID=A0ABQ4CEP5_9ACTN|nr:VOC family protein [Asanoa iriomotensis]GIF60941.1 glyoxalase [Asanoa iriomotensis]
MSLHISLFELVVTDMAKSLAFYRALGVSIPESADNEPHVDVALPGGMRLAFDTVETIRSFNPGWQAPTGSPRASLAFRCDSPAEVDEVYARMTRDGWSGVLEPFDAFWGHRYATLHDPDGTGVDLFADLS